MHHRKTIKSSYQYAACRLAVGCAFLAFACVTARSTRPGVVANNTFSPSRPPASRYGGDQSWTCPTTGAFGIVRRELEPDGRLCAVAEAFLGWNPAEILDQQTLDFVSTYFGLPSSPSQVLMGRVETDDPRAIAGQFLEALWKFRTTAAQPRFGLAIQRFAGPSKLVLVLEDPIFDVDPIPRRLALNSEYRFRGRLLRNLRDPTILITDSMGRLETLSSPGGQAFEGNLRCGSKPGLIQVEIHAAENGADKVVGSFPVFCGKELPTTISIARAAEGPLDVAGEERKVSEIINAERTAVGLPPLLWDDRLSDVARSISERRREAASSETASTVDLPHLLKQVRVASRLVLQNPGRGPTPTEVQLQFSRSPGHRANYMNAEVTNVGIGVAPGMDEAGHSMVYVTEVFIKSLPPVDRQAVRENLYALVARRRAAAQAPKMERDPVLEETAQRYALELVALNGNLSRAQSDELLAGLRKRYRTLDVMAGAKANPLELGEEPEIVGSARQLGIGVAEGAHPLLGDEAVYIAILIGTRR